MNICIRNIHLMQTHISRILLRHNYLQNKLSRIIKHKINGHSHLKNYLLLNSLLIHQIHHRLIILNNINNKRMTICRRQKNVNNPEFNNLLTLFRNSMMAMNLNDDLLIYEFFMINLFNLFLLNYLRYFILIKFYFI